MSRFTIPCFRSKPKYVAFDEVLDTFAHELGTLAAHLREHYMKEGDAERAASIEECVALVTRFRAYEGPALTRATMRSAAERRAWAEQWDWEEDGRWVAIWDHICDNARDWWC